MLFTGFGDGSQIYNIDRIGNPELHKTLPIQSKFATCIHQGTDIKYWCDPNDNRFRKDTERYKFNVELSIKETLKSCKKIVDRAATLNTSNILYSGTA